MKYIVSFKPAQPYFFGSEKNFKLPGKNEDGFGDLYYISSEDTPSQTTILGALRYALLPYTAFTGLTEEQKAANDAAIGPASFSFDVRQKQEFGLIKSISPLFILSDDGKEVYVPAPMDHNMKVSENYCPFEEYSAMDTADGEKLFAKDFAVKEGTAAGQFMEIHSGRLRKDLISTQLRVGINRGKTEDGFFKRDYKQLLSGLSFAVVADFAEGFSTDSCVLRHEALLGQSRTPFKLKFEAVSSDNDPFGQLEERMKERHSGVTAALKGCSLIYCQGDALYTRGDSVYADTVFASTAFREYRPLTTSKAGGYAPSRVLRRLIKAGSIFIVSDDKLQNWLAGFDCGNTPQAGFNSFCITRITVIEEEKQNGQAS